MYGCAIDPQVGGKVFSEGLPNTNKMNQIVSVQNVQEQPFSAPQGGVFLFNSGNDTSLQFRFRFTDFSIGQGSRRDVFLSGTAMAPFQSISFMDFGLCGALLRGNCAPTVNYVIALTNNLFERCMVGFTFYNTYSDGTHYGMFHCYNNSFI